MEDQKKSPDEKVKDKLKEASIPDEKDPLYSKDDYMIQLPLDEKHGGQDEPGGFDEALELAGSWDRYQKWVFFVAYASQIFCGMHAVSAAFLGATPEHWCRVPGLPEETSVENSSLLRNLTIPWSPDEGYSKCKYYDIKDYNHTLTEFNQSRLQVSSQEIHRCSSWVFDASEFQSTLVSDFSLVCGRLWLKAAVQASYMSGLLIGSLAMGQLSDRFGRRTITLISTFLAIAVGILASFANSFPFFLLLRFVLAFVNAGPMVICFVLVMELVKPGVRTFTGMMYAFFFGSGITILPGIAYFIRDWRHLQLAISLLNGILMSYYWILPESPRWLASQGRIAEALKIMKTIAKVNRRTLPPDHYMITLMTGSNIKLKVNDDTEEQGGICSGVIKMFSKQIDLIRTPVMRRRCIIGFYVWFVSASAYYGLIFSGGNIRANLFLMIFVSGMVEIPSVFISIFIMNRIGRRLTMIGLFMATAACCLLILAVPKEHVYVNFCLVNLGKFFTTAVFALCFLYTSELVPTVVRNIAVGTSSMFARVGCIITPFVVELLGEIHFALPSTLFGILSLIAATFTLLLPETSNKKLTETIDEVEEMDK